MTGAELLELIPQHLRNLPLKDLDGQTPTQAAEYYDDCIENQQPHCLMCFQELQRLGES